jgi:hypothetical protein
VAAVCTSAVGNRIFAPDRRKCELRPTQHTWVPAVASRCSDLAGVTVTTGGNQTQCTGLSANHTFHPGASAYCVGVCLDAQGNKQSASSQTACSSSSSSTWRTASAAQSTDKDSCELQPSGNSWLAAVIAACLDKDGGVVGNVTSRKDCERSFLTGQCDGRLGRCSCAIGYTGDDCSQAVITPATAPPPDVEFWRTAVWLVSVSVAAPCLCACLCCPARKARDASATRRCRGLFVVQPVAAAAQVLSRLSHGAGVHGHLSKWRRMSRWPAARSRHCFSNQ